MRRANHQLTSSDSRPSGIAFQITAVINRDSGCRVASVGRWAMMPQPVAGTGAYPASIDTPRLLRTCWAPRSPRTTAFTAGLPTT
ncbi:hypothetical protein G6F59_016413 [Rhizopus arrhizus]|nr:hypothetical protein G6F59_016413 [Rhizopus arrhizus]